MPVAWILVTVGSLALFAIVVHVAFPRAPWLAVYLISCVPASVIWLLQQWDISSRIRPLILMFQAFAVIEAVDLMHLNCPRPRRRYLFAASCGLCGSALGFLAVSYPQFPEGLWRAQFLLESVSCIGIAAALILLGWFPCFQVEGWTIGNAAAMMVYCGLEAGALLFQCLPKRLLTLDNWVAVDVTLSLAQDCCLLWWLTLHSGDLEQGSYLANGRHRFR